jgi:hypothetical protein
VKIAREITDVDESRWSADGDLKPVYRANGHGH